MVLINLGGLNLEAEKFETRTMPTPDMKSKEMIYWIKVKTNNKRLIVDLKRFLDGSAKFIDLKVPSALVWAKTELEDYRIYYEKNYDMQKVLDVEKNKSETRSKETNPSPYSTPTQEPQDGEISNIEIILRRVIQDAPRTQSPYG